MNRPLLGIDAEGLKGNYRLDAYVSSKYTRWSYQGSKPIDKKLIKADNYNCVVSIINSEMAHFHIKFHVIDEETSYYTLTRL